MYSLVPTPTFKRDIKRLSQKHWPVDELKPVVNLLAAGTSVETLSKKYADHALASSSSWKGYRELHVDGPRGDWLLIYKIEQQELILTLVRTGSHKDFLGK
ncbi:MAG: type II toxin-antitoxin system YafQ family toxin [Liquorilactobacillus nagelii]|uniref:type II toxin-antitoxin system YafQ family toxin n=1 Tax=Liquorilactobacillus nagelii TaxID=82688 RepID=UPI0039E8BA17